MNTPSLSGIGQVSLIAHDLERATAFYRDILCLEFLFSAGGMSFFNVNGIRLMLGPSGGNFEHGSSVLYYRVAEIGREHERLLAAGVRVLEAPREIFRQQGHALWLAFYADSEGNAFSLMEEKGGLE
ncbi:MAG TPA: VOC family protein [Gammaproteobacteria bacterium]